MRELKLIVLKPEDVHLRRKKNFKDIKFYDFNADIIDKIERSDVVVYIDQKKIKFLKNRYEIMREPKNIIKQVLVTLHNIFYR
jgi:hypothetical protein